MKQRVLFVPDEDLYLAFRLPTILRETGYGVVMLCVAGDSSRHLGQTHHRQGERGVFPPGCDPEK